MAKNEVSANCFSGTDTISFFIEFFQSHNLYVLRLQMLFSILFPQEVFHSRYYFRNRVMQRPTVLWY